MPIKWLGEGNGSLKTFQNILNARLPSKYHEDALKHWSAKYAYNLKSNNKIKLKATSTKSTPWNTGGGDSTSTPDKGLPSPPPLLPLLPNTPKFEPREMTGVTSLVCPSNMDNAVADKYYQALLNSGVNETIAYSYALEIETICNSLSSGHYKKVKAKVDTLSTSEILEFFKWRTVTVKGNYRDATEGQTFTLRYSGFTNFVNTSEPASEDLVDGLTALGCSILIVGGYVGILLVAAQASVTTIKYLMMFKYAITGNYVAFSELYFDSSSIFSNVPSSGGNYNQNVLAEMNKNEQFYKDNIDWLDCSEIADDLFEAAGGKGKIYKITPNQGLLNVEEYSSVRQFTYHTVYSDGTYIYDPRYSMTPVTESNYFSALRNLNTNGISFK